MIRLFVRLDELALLRQQSGAADPEPVLAAGLCELAGADGITVHLREDRAHVQERDLRILRQTVRGLLNLDMATAPSIMDRALQIAPDICTLMPKKPGKKTVTSLNLNERLRDLGQIVRTLRGANIDVSLLINPDEESAKACVDLGASQVELCAWWYANAKPCSAEARRQLARLEKAGRVLVDAGLRLAVGHGLDYANIREVAGLANLDVISVGHAVISRALMVGMEQAVLDMRKAIDEGVREAHRE